MNKKIWLIILDWFWLSEQIENNAIKKANTPTFDKLFSENYSELEASEEFVWLPKWQMWNSEVWHLTIGSGRLLKQSLVEINELFESNEFKNIKEFKDGIAHCKKNNSKLHLLTLFWHWWVHSCIKQLEWKIKIIPKDIKVCLHLFSDGRDLAKDSMLWLLEKFLIFLKDYTNVEITTISWRFYAMDRDNNWDRIEPVYDTIISWENKVDISPLEYIKENYKNEVYDEFFKPVNFTANTIESWDTIFHLNFRSDRASQLLKAIHEEENIFKKKKIKNIYICTMTKFYKEYKWNTFIKTKDIKNTLWEVLQNNNLSQLHLAETEKFAHVTKFFNGWKQIVYKWEKDILVDSPKVINYKETPEMSAYKILDLYKNEASNYDFTVINFANWDMLGHTWDMSAAIQTVEILDDIVKQLLKLSKENNIDLYISADHWNCELMFDQNWEIVKSHTTNRVPLWHIQSWIVKELKEKYWTIADIAPTILNNLWVNIPKEMTGKNLK